LADLLTVRKGGINPGTWMHEDVAMEFALWLSPEFAIWCNDRIKEILLDKANPKKQLSSGSKYNRQKIDTYVSVEEHEQLKNLCKAYGFKSTYHCLQYLIRSFMRNANGIQPETTSLHRTIENLSQMISFQHKALKIAMDEADYYKSMYKDRCKFVEEIVPFVQDMNRQITKLTKQSEEEKKLLKRAKAALSV
jgi:hypothetical protein